MTPRKATRADVAHALRAYPDGVTPSILSADLKVRPEAARSALNRLHEYGGCVREGNLYRPLNPQEVQTQVLALLTRNPDQEYGHLGVRQALPWLHLSAQEAETCLRTLHEAGRLTHEHDPTDDPWHWYGVRA